jgi:uncharacterized peroxidase-related enzyme
MARVEPLSREEARELDDAFAPVEERMGFLPNSMLTMARRPEILRALAALTQAARAGTVSPELKELVALIASGAAGCRYCEAHTASNATRKGADDAKIAQVWSYETSELFTDAERAALRLAQHAAVVPNAATEEDFVELRRHFDDGEIVELMTMIALFGFLNRWNDTLATDLETTPLELATLVIGPAGWKPGKHASGGARDRASNAYRPR